MYVSTYVHMSVCQCLMTTKVQDYTIYSNTRKIRISLADSGYKFKFHLSSTCTIVFVIKLQVRLFRKPD